jgi:hypothetical protein
LIRHTLPIRLPMRSNRGLQESRQPIAARNTIIKQS